jgi:hypothetical protein
LKNLIVTTLIALTSIVAAAQTSPGTAPPASTTPNTQPQTSPSQSSDIGGAGNQMPTSDKSTEKTLKGCLESSGAQFTLEEKRGKQVALTGSQDLASHVGHTVMVHGSYTRGSDPSSVTRSSTNSGMGSGEQFMVTKLDMVSGKCSAPKTKSKDINKDTNNDPSGKPSPYRY